MEQTNLLTGNTKTVNRLGYYIAIATAVLCLGTFIIAFLTPPITGPFCIDPCLEYPYEGIESRFPRDYLWMYPAMILNVLFIVLMASINQFSMTGKKVFGQIGFSFALVSGTLLIVNYFLQVSVIQPSLLNGETSGIALLTQYNPHGIFIALEEIAYLMMSLSFFFMAFVFSNTNPLEKAIRWILIISFALTIISLLFFSIVYGVNREYLFEIAIISIDWTVLIVFSILSSIVFRRAMKPILYERLYRQHPLLNCTQNILFIDQKTNP